MVLLVIQIHSSLHLIEGWAEHSLADHDGKAEYIANQRDWQRGPHHADRHTAVT
jgi:hypothetical protein